MEGFVSTKIARNNKKKGIMLSALGYGLERGLMSDINEIFDSYGVFESETELAEEHFKYMKAGFIIDEENDVYVYPGYGAFASNLDDIKSIDELAKYEEIVRQIQEEGYEYVLGPAGPAMNGYIPDCYGLYCKNYLEIAKRQKKKRK